MSFWGQSHQNMRHVKAHGFVTIVPFYIDQHNSIVGLKVKSCCCTLEHSGLGISSYILAPVHQSDLACLEHSAFAVLYHICHPSAWTTDSACPLLRRTHTHTHFPLISNNEIKQLQPFSLFWIAPCNSLQWVMATVLSWWKLTFFPRQEILTLMQDKYFQRKITHLSKLWMPSALKIFKEATVLVSFSIILNYFALKNQTTLAFNCNN